MKIEVKQENLSKALSAVSRVASTRGQMPILADILLKIEDGQLVVAATNLEMSITEKISAKVDQEGIVAVPARLITEFINNLPHVPVKIENKDRKINISAGGFNSIINGGDSDEFPALPEVENSDELIIPSDIFRESVSSVAPVASSDITRPILTGVYLHSSDGELIMAATDGYRLAERKLLKTKLDINAIIPSSTLNEVSRLITDGDKNITIKISDEQISFQIGDVNLISRLIDGKFIAYQQLIPSNTDFSILANKNELVRAVKVAGIFAGTSTGSVVLKTDAKKQTISITALASELGENNAEIEAEISGDQDGLVTLNSKFLLDALNFISSETIHIRFSGKLAPVLITGKDDIYNHIIMPVKS